MSADVEQLLNALMQVQELLVECDTCGNVDTTNPCGICADPRRDMRAICVVEEVADLWALDRARLFTGKYHVLAFHPDHPPISLDAEAGEQSMKFSLVVPPSEKTP